MVVEVALLNCRESVFDDDIDCWMQSHADNYFADGGLAVVRIDGVLVVDEVVKSSGDLAILLSVSAAIASQGS